MFKKHTSFSRSYKKRTLLLYGFCSLIFFHLAQAQDFQPITITYELDLNSSKLGNATLGKLIIGIEKKQAFYAVTSSTKAQGLAAILLGSNLQESCLFSIENGRVRSNQYAGGTKNKEKYRAQFDWQEKKILFQDKETIDMPKGYIIDNCSMPFAAALLAKQDLANETLFVLEGKKKRIRGYTMISQTEETIDTPLGKKNTQKIVLQRELNPSKTFTLWLSDEFQNMPLKMEEKRSSRTLTMLVHSVEQE